MAHSDRILMGPGPGNPYPEAIAAFGRPMLEHLDPEFIALLDETNDRIREVFQTANQLTFSVSATSSGAECHAPSRGSRRDPAVSIPGPSGSGRDRVRRLSDPSSLEE